ncbi:MAG: VacJ family lipoprotein [Campylobacteraceae bacterium]|nr:VacJ family lipoprotein [Campylobacteraceae bacterium]MBT3882730.1 VacJ family lipoprotein [Campylobacteraceae bacterium]MBT4029896.1 VacJ family lipoprotein [Campylobacteraceae bacterium]MBT4179096.1 VacJ family lipoprotein [Campylobacteraceae bacterium]MBT4572930.1 VacJ family lipoprotein [Campylobacteraceae bacterium]
MKLLSMILLYCSITLNLYSAHITDFVPQSDYNEVNTHNIEENFDDEFSSEEAITIEKCPSLEDYNRFMTKHNDNLYINILTPLSNGYKNITNEPVRDSIDNFFYNLAFPIRFINNILQFEIIDASEEVAVFAVNTTVGIVGLFQPAQKYFKLKTHKEDFGQTLGVYGFDSGCHIVLPFFGPSNIRDIVGMTINTNFDALHYSHHKIEQDNLETIGIKMFEKLNGSPKSLEDYQHIKDDAVDLYPYLKDIYEQYRTQQIKE